jgi:hypothetical protein
MSATNNGLIKATIGMYKANPHIRVHHGKHFTISHSNKTLAAGEVLTVQLTTGEKECHAVVDYGLNSIGSIELLEAPTTSSGTALTAINNNRVSSNVTTATIVHTPTVTADGTLLELKLIEGTGGGQAIGSSGGSRIEFILKPSTKYLVRMTNDNNAASRAWVNVSWYEED